uniref:Uncharacterized protein n=1 Tax=Fagus sylvatica TaxID=28930 RepID=A0A2N9EE54_FAGSY
MVFVTMDNPIEFLFTSLNEVWPAYLLWSWINLVAEVLVVFFAIYK